MDSKRIKSLINLASMIWMPLALVLAGLTFAGIMPKSLFLPLFLGGMVVYGVGTGILNSALMDRRKREAETMTSSQDNEGKKDPSA